MILGHAQALACCHAHLSNQHCKKMLTLYYRLLFKVRQGLVDLIGPTCCLYIKNPVVVGIWTAYTRIYPMSLH